MLNRSSRLAAAGLLALLAGCSTGSTVTPAQVTAVSTDTIALIADIQAAATGTPLTAAQLAVISAQTSKLQADVTALNAGTTGTTAASILGDVTTAINDVSPFLPEIGALLALAAPAPGAASASYLQTKALGDFARLRADAGAA
jgi:hypothetical protein